MRRDPAIQLRHLFQIVSGSTPDSGNTEYWNGDIPWITPEDVSQVDGAVLSDTRRKLTSAGFKNSGASMVGSGAIVLTKRAPIGQLALLGLEACSNQGCFLLSAREGADPRFFYYVLANSVPILQALGRGSTFMELSTDDLKALKVPVPEYAAQIKIANHLDRETARLDALVRAKQRVLDLLAEKRKAIIATAVTRGLDPQVKLRDSGVPWLGEIPAHWEVWRSKRLFHHRNERADLGSTPLTASQDYGVIPQSEFMVREGRRVVQVETGADILKKVMENDFVISMRSFQGGIELSRHAGAASSAYVVLVPSAKVFVPFYVLLFKSTSYIQALRSTSSLVRDGQALRYENFSLIDLPLPPFEEQIRIAEIVNGRTAKLTRLADATIRTIELLKERRSALITAAVTGQIDGGATV